eukprot:g7038.t1
MIPCRPDVGPYDARISSDHAYRDKSAPSGGWADGAFAAIHTAHVAYCDGPGRPPVGLAPAIARAGARRRARGQKPAKRSITATVQSNSCGCSSTTRSRKKPGREPPVPEPGASGADGDDPDVVVTNTTPPSPEAAAGSPRATRAPTARLGSFDIMEIAASGDDPTDPHIPLTERLEILIDVIITITSKRVAGYVSAARVSALQAGLREGYTELRRQRVSQPDAPPRGGGGAIWQDDAVRESAYCYAWATAGGCSRDERDCKFEHAHDPAKKKKRGGGNRNGNRSRGNNNPAGGNADGGGGGGGGGSGGGRGGGGGGGGGGGSSGGGSN